MRIFTISVLSLILLASCKTKEYTPYEYDGEILVFGGGGGFAGKVYQYTLMSNGQFYKGTHKEGKVYELPKLEKRKAKQLFKSYHSLGFDNVSLVESGNLYKFFVLHEGEKEHKIMWADSGVKASEEITIYYDNLMALARKANKEIKDKKEELPVQ